MERAEAHVLVDDLGHPSLSAGDAHHLARVLRLGPGATVTAGDGHGRWRLCLLEPAGGAHPLALRTAGGIETEPAPRPPIAVGFALTKGERPDWTVQKLTELGVDRIVPLLAARSVVRPERERAARQLARWRRIAREAACQARRAWVPEVAEVTTFVAAAATPGAVLAHPGGRAPDLADALVLVGPEGGWAPAELEAAPHLPRVTLGPLVVRAETAAMAAATLLAALRAGIVTNGNHTG